jgi:hypothetical protein
MKRELKKILNCFNENGIYEEKEQLQKMTSYLGGGPEDLITFSELSDNFIEIIRATQTAKINKGVPL